MGRVPIFWRSLWLLAQQLCHDTIHTLSWTRGRGTSWSDENSRQEYHTIDCFVLVSPLTSSNAVHPEDQHAHRMKATSSSFHSVSTSRSIGIVDTYPRRLQSQSTLWRDTTQFMWIIHSSCAFSPYKFVRHFLVLDLRAQSSSPSSLSF